MPKRNAKHLTAEDVKRAKPKEKPYELRDAKEAGLLLRVQPSGVKSWVVVYTVDGKKTRSTLGDASKVTLGRARAKAKDKTSAADKGIDLAKDEREANRALLGEYIKGAYAKYAKANILSYEDVLTRLPRNWKDLYKRSMAQITPLDIERWRKKKSKKDNPAGFETLQKELAYLKACLNTAVKVHKVIPSHQLTGHNLTRQTQDLQDTKQTAPRYLEPAEETALRAALDAREQDIREARDRMRSWQRERGKELSPAIPADHFADHVKPIVLLAMNTGLRRGDLFSLEWRHVDLKNRQIRKVINKTRRKNPKLTPAVLPLSPEAVQVFDTWRKQTTGEGLVFPSPATGGELDNINGAWRGVVKAAGITNFRFHDLRHSFASKLVMAGIPLNTVRELMTHAKMEMTLVYAHLSPSHKEDAINLVFGGASSGGAQ